VYRKTSSEGVRTSTSATVTVAVTAGCTQVICPQSVGPQAP